LGKVISDRDAAYQRFIETAKLPGLDGLRALAILPVIWHHSTPRPLPGLLGKGAVGVDLFFALSGFLITTLLLRERRATSSIRLGAFYARRSLRIFPLYYLVLGLYGLRALQTAHDSEAARHFLHSLPYHASYTANWFVNYQVPHPVIFAFSWSLCVEEQFYWLWPGLVKFLKNRAVLATVMAGVVALDWWIEAFGGMRGTFPSGSLALRMVTSFSTPIGCGCLVAILLDTRCGFRWAHCVLGKRWAAPLCLLAVVYFLSREFTPYLWLSGALALLVGAVAIRPDSGLSWLVERRVLVRIGVLSYALYLLHVTALGLVRRLVPSFAESSLFVFGVGLPLSALFAEIAHRLVERKFLALRARFR
jgi:peptidoglycan/LPS O-acetylase OafA/YrhL